MFFTFINSNIKPQTVYMHVSLTVIVTVYQQ